MRLSVTALPLPEPSQTRCGAKLPRLAMLRARRVNRCAEAFFGGGLVVCLGEVQFAFEAVQFGLSGAVVVLLGNHRRFVQRLVRFLELPFLRVCMAQNAEI